MSEVMQENRRMIRAELMGSHTHNTFAGIEVHIWKRGPHFLARGSISGERFGETIGVAEVEATGRLRQILSDIDSGTYVRPSEARKRPLTRGTAARWTLRQLVNEFLVEKRRVRGQQTFGDYKVRLMPVLAFAEQAESVKRWRLAVDIDREFVAKLRAFLYSYRTTRNGRTGGKSRPMSERQIYNVLQCLRTLFAWASRPDVRKLPATWLNPLTEDLIGSRPSKDPLREDLLSLETRIQLVGRMDQWQLCNLALFLVLPMRPDEVTGLLVSDVNFDRGWLEFGQQLSDINFTKESTAFKVPFPDELKPILRACIADRAEGPLLRGRTAFAGAGAGVSSTDELRRLYDEALRDEPRDSVQSAHDRKLLFRRVLRELGGVSEDALAGEFKKLLSALGIAGTATLYTLRSSVTTAMKNAKLPHLELRYLTSHSTNDILNTYASLDPVGAMRQYFTTIEPLLSAITSRSRELGLNGETPPEPVAQELSFVDRLSW